MINKIRLLCQVIVRKVVPCVCQKMTSTAQCNVLRCWKIAICLR